MSEASLERIERALHERIGLDPTTVGSSLVRRAIARRMSLRNVQQVDAYAALLYADVAELQELVEEVVIPETYFWREPHALEAVAQRAASAHRRGETRSPTRVLSAPCSTGEEPYSIAMAMLAAGMDPTSIAIDAVDLSVNAVRAARAAVYRNGSFRDGSSNVRHYFEQTPKGMQLQQRVRDLVRVVQGNLLDTAFRAPRDQYDYVFCRNLLIYFDAHAQERVLATLTALLAPDGVLVVGAADTFAVRRAGLVPVAGAERAFLFQRSVVGASGEAMGALSAGSGSSKRRARPRAQRTPRETKSPVIRSSPVALEAPSPKPVAPAKSSTSIVREVVRLAGSGRLEDAVRLGETANTASAADAELLAIMGTTYAALRNDARAEACYRQALYLDPSHTDALVHLALLLEARGDSASARRLRSRVRRALDASSGGAA